VLVSCALGGCTGSPQTLVSGAYAPAVKADDVFVFQSSDATSFALTRYPSGDFAHPSTLCTGQSQPGGVAVDGANVYWTTTGASAPTTGAVMKCAIGGCTAGPTVMASGQEAGDYPDLVAVDGTTVYWVDSLGQRGVATVRTCPTSGLAIDDENIYWTSTSPAGGVVKCPKTGCNGPPTPLISTQYTSAGPIAVDATSIYWIIPYQGTLMRLAK
jgi:hypothetical protein